MASNAPTAKSKPDRPLSFMTKLSPTVYYYKPDPSPTAIDPKAPKLILLGAWMGAREAHIAKYLLPYQALYPTAKILLLRFEPHHLFPLFPWRRRAFEAEYATALPVLRAVADEIQASQANTQGTAVTNQQQKKPEILVHIWSNGGSLSLTTVYNLYKKAYGQTFPFPRHTIIFDSCPGQFRYKASVTVMVQPMPFFVKLLALPLVHAINVWYWFWHVVVRTVFRPLRGFLERVADGHNDLSEGFGGRARTEVRRSYIYGPGDELIMSRDVEDHAADAKRRGLGAVRTEVFAGSKHVQHVRADEERYWKVVRETWEGVGY